MFYQRCVNIHFLPKEPDETIAERLWGLTEMLPQPVQKICGNVTSFSVKSVKNVYKFSCTASWIFFTSSMILFAPILFEMERAQMEELEKSQQKQVYIHIKGKSKRNCYRFNVLQM